MAIYPVPLKLELTDDRLIDIFILQWHTPLPVHQHNWEKIQTELAEEKLSILSEFHDWLLRDFLVSTPPRPLFIVAPELSLPICCDKLLNQIVNETNRPSIAIAGLEYLCWDEYSELVSNLPYMPHPEDWLTGGREDVIVNAASIWIRDADREVKHYIQPKLHPQDHEQAIPLYQGQHTLIFHSTNQATGPRLNFCVQICSDFTNATFVKELRQSIIKECEPLRIDFTFLLQCNPDQNVDQFKQAVQEYFAPPDGKVPTEDGCLAFVNNANETPGKSEMWGQSKIHFPFERWRNLNFAPPTYWLSEGGANNQSVTLRESGPGIYWLTYKPHYLVDPIPGSGQTLPFPSSYARFASIEGPKLRQEGTGTDLFAPIPAVCNWLKGEWNEGESDLQADLTDNDIDPDVSAHYLCSYQTGVNTWYTVIAHDDLARNAVNTYLECWKKDFFPSKEPEPQKWCQNVSEAVKRMMRIYALLLLGTSSLPGGSIYPDVLGVRHASTDSELRVTFLWGGGKFSTEKMITIYHATREERGLDDLLSRKCLLILVNPEDHLDKTSILDAVEKADFSIVQGISPNNVAPHLQSGDVVDVRGREQLRCLYDGELAGEVSLAEDRDDLGQRLERVIEEELR